jgi:hypothetical protein
LPFAAMKKAALSIRLVQPEPKRTGR